MDNNDIFNIYAYQNELYAIRRIDGVCVLGINLQDDFKMVHCFNITRMTSDGTDIYDFVTWYVVYNRIVHKRDIKTFGDAMLIVEGKQIRKEATRIYDNEDYFFKILKKVLPNA